MVDLLLLCSSCQIKVSVVAFNHQSCSINLAAGSQPGPSLYTPQASGIAGSTLLLSGRSYPDRENTKCRAWFQLATIGH